MKTIKALLAVGLLAGVAMADTTKNPDRYTSVGIDFTRMREAGVLATYPVLRPDGKTINHQDFIGYSQSSLNLDLRVPVTNHLTVNVHGSPLWSDIPGARVDGYSFGAGVRFYLPDNIGMLGR